MHALSYVIEVVREKQAAGVIGDEIFFRGQREKHELVPSLLRKDKQYAKPLPKTENNLYCDALVMAAGELARTGNSWETLALLQHYEVPTRLLDWTSSLTSALFFALLRCLKCNKAQDCRKLRQSCDGNPVIWVLDPHKMHQRLFPSDPVCDKVAITIGVDPVADYMQEFVLNEAGSNQWPHTAGPVFLEIPWTNARMKSQKGFFTFHPDERPLESLIDESGGLVKVLIPKKYRGDIINEFKAVGVNEHDIFTDLVSLANFFKRRYTKP